MSEVSRMPVLRRLHSRWRVSRVNMEMWTLIFRAWPHVAPKSHDRYVAEMYRKLGI